MESEPDLVESGYPRFKLLLLAFLAEGALFVIAIVSASYFNIEIFHIPQHVIRDLCIGTLGAVPPFALFVYIMSGTANNFFIRSLKKNVRSIKYLFSDTHFIDLVIISLMAGIAEEFLFRGVIQKGLGIIAASVLFGFFHLISIPYAIVTIAMGFYLGIFYSLGGSLSIPVQIHFIYDLSALAYLRYGTISQQSHDDA